MRMQDHRLLHVPCPVCGADSPRPVAREGPLGIVRCGACRLVYVTPRLAEPQAHYHGERDAVLRKYGAILRGEKGHNRDPNYEQELAVLRRQKPTGRLDRKSTRLNSSHANISYAVFCLKKKKLRSVRQIRAE